MRTVPTPVLARAVDVPKPRSRSPIICPRIGDRRCPDDIAISRCIASPQDHPGNDPDRDGRAWIHDRPARGLKPVPIPISKSKSRRKPLAVSSGTPGAPGLATFYVRLLREGLVRPDDGAAHIERGALGGRPEHATLIHPIAPPRTQETTAGLKDILGAIGAVP